MNRKEIVIETCHFPLASTPLNCDTLYENGHSAQARQGYDEEGDVINPNPLEALLDFCHLALF